MGESPWEPFGRIGYVCLSLKTQGKLRISWVLGPQGPQTIWVPNSGKWWHGLPRNLTCSPCWSTVLAAVAAMLCQRCCRNAAVVVAMLLLCWCCNVVATEPEAQWHNQAQVLDTDTSTGTGINTNTRKTISTSTNTGTSTNTQNHKQTAENQTNKHTNQLIDKQADK